MRALSLELLVSGHNEEEEDGEKKGGMVGLPHDSRSSHPCGSRDGKPLRQLRQYDNTLMLSNRCFVFLFAF